MPPGFTDEEKARISGLLLASGQRLFPAQGLRKTSLAELVAPAGIAKSTFYLFFDSKEALYLELMLRQAGEVKRRVIDEALLAGADTRDGLRRFLHATLAEFRSNPLWRRLIAHPQEMDAVARKVAPEQVAGMADNPATALAAYLAGHAGDLVEADPAVLTGVLQAVLLLPLHADRLGAPEHYPQIADLLIDIVATGLTSPRTGPEGRP
ncbi:MAG: TetR/AcrR family transcriptional regulator [Nocardiopsaceae bacterium]|jgi:AcrR family transcriptional regulator|nr:TetR/AcrR family transcriptional regulator [Nocardiopsaceae bacterium]